MTGEFSELSKELQQRIWDISLDRLRQPHMPIAFYIDEMNLRALLLDEHRSLYLERLTFDVADLRDSIQLFTGILFNQQYLWKNEEKKHESSLFWYRNKKRLYDLNRELRKRLGFEFRRFNNSSALAAIEVISSSDNDGDAVDDGRHLKGVLKESMDQIAGGIYSRSELEEFVLFYERIEEARSAALVEKSAPHDARILRDKIYLHLRSIEKEVYAAADACFVKEPKERSRYGSAYLRAVHKKSNAKRRGRSRK